MLGEQDLVGSLELTCRGSTWIPLRLGSLDIQAPWLPCLQPGDQSRFGERPHCRKERDRIGLDGKVDRSYQTTLQDPFRPEVLVGRRERPGRQVDNTKTGIPDATSNSSEQRQERLREVGAKRITRILRRWEPMATQLVKSTNIFQMPIWTRNLTHI